MSDITGVAPDRLELAAEEILYACKLRKTVADTQMRDPQWLTDGRRRDVRLAIGKAQQHLSCVLKAL